MNFDKVYQWVRRLPQGNPFLLGINGPQGSGKTTLSTALCHRLKADGIEPISISIDDFYLTRSEQIALAAQHPDNPYLQQRGYPGTHDVHLGAQVLRDLKSHGVAKIPRYDKSAHQGHGDRAGWSEVTRRPDLVIVEGWMLGFTPTSTAMDLSLAVTNELLAGYKAWHEPLDGFLQLAADDFHHVLHWRVEAEEKMKAAGKPGMSTEEVTRYAQLFMPAYAAWLPQLAQHPPVSQNVLVVPITRDRLSM